MDWIRGEMEQDNHRKNLIEGRQKPKRRGSKDFGRDAYEDDRYQGIRLIDSYRVLYASRIWY